MSIQEFHSKAEAEAVISTMAGWETEIVDYLNMDGEHCYVIMAKTYGAQSSFGYLHNDGHVR